MFIELAEFLSCPKQHERDSYCILVPEEVAGRTVFRGVIACPICEDEFPIVDGVADFTGGVAPDRVRRPESAVPVPRIIHALLGVESPGGCVVLVGSAALLAEPLADLLDVHFVALNPPAGLESSRIMSLFQASRVMPLRSSMARGVVIGGEHGREPWLGEGGRVLLGGCRLVVMKEDVSVPGVERLAVEHGLWVGEKT